MKRIDGLIQLVLCAALIAAIIYGCRPAESQAGPDSLLYRQCVRHLELCERCRAAGLTAERMVARELPAGCRVSGMSEGEGDGSEPEGE